MIAIALFDAVDILIIMVDWIYRCIHNIHIYDSSDILCGSWWFLLYVSVYSSVWCMVAMTTEKLVVIVYPLKAKLWFSRRRCKMVVICITVVMVTLNVHNIVARKLVIDSQTNIRGCIQFQHLENVTTTEHFILIYWPWIDATVYCFIPIVCISIINVTIYVVLYHVEKKRNKLTNSTSHKTNEIGISVVSTLSRVSMNLTFMPKRLSMSRDSCRSTSSLDDNSPNNRKTSTLSEAPNITTRNITISSSTTDQVFKMCIIVTSAFVIFTMPLSVLLIVLRGGSMSGVDVLLWTVAGRLTFTNHAVNCFIYSAIPKFRQELLQLFMEHMQRCQKVTLTPSSRSCTIDSVSTQC